MKVLGRAAGSAREGLTDGSTGAAWRRAGLLGTFLLALVLVLAPGNLRAAGTFAPTVTFETSTTQAAAHPDARITVNVGANDDDLKSLDIQLPDGFWGSLDAAVPCKWNTTANNASAGTCLPTAKIGSITASAKTKATPDAPDSDMVLSGDLFLTDASTANAATDPAGLTAVIQAKVGGVDLGKVIVHARAIPVYRALTEGGFSNLPSGTLGPALGLKTVVDDIPNSVTDSHGRTVTFHTTKMVIDLRSDQTPPRQPLLTNPARCNNTPVFKWSASSYAVGSPVASTQNYVPTGCANVPRGTTSFSTTLSNPVPNGTTNLIADMTMKENAGTLRRATVALPAMVGFSSPGYGSASQMCDVDSRGFIGLNGVNAVQVFNPANCPDTARFGSVKVWTPLLKDPLVGYAYLVNASTPNIGIFISPDTDAGSATPNPAGITISLFGLSTAKPSSKDPEGSCVNPNAPDCELQLKVDFDGLPAAPVSRIQVDTYRADRPVLDKEILAVNTSAVSPRCQRTSDARAQLYYNAGATLTEHRGAVSGISVPGCSQPDPAYVSNSTSPIGTSTTNASPTFSFGAGATGNCAVDYVQNIDEDLESDPVVAEHYNYLPCSETYASTGGTQQAKNPLSAGLHYFYYTPDGENERVRAFAIDPPANETTPPTVTFNSGPSGDTSDSTPSFAFSATESSLFQCSLDSGAYLPCTNGAAATSSTYEVPEALLASDDDHTISVRATDSFGNLSDEVTRTFKIVIPFDPSYTAVVSDYQARAHPELDVTIDSLSHEDLDELLLELPDGFLGSLRGAVQCDTAVANAGNCGPESQVGTVETEAAIDRSIARINGQVYMTTAWSPGDPAGLVVKVPAKIQDVNLGDINVPIRLKVRGQVKGIDSVAVDIPNSIDPAVSGNTFDSLTEFDMRSIKLKLRNNSSASQPLLTNPSSCAPTAFKATYKGTAATTVTKTQGFTASNCGALGFAPQISLSLLDSKTGKPPVESTNTDVVSGNLTADLTADPNGSGISNTTLLLPKSVTVNVPKLPFPCTVAEYESGGAAACPAGSIVGSATANSPLLLQPLSGYVYLVKSSVPTIQLPRILVALRGAINTDILGNMTFDNTDPKNARIKTTFPDLPDAPLSTFHISVDRVISTRPNACQFPDSDGFAQTSFAGFSGSASSATNFLPVTCNGSGTGKFKNKRSKSTMSLSLRAPDGAKITKIKSIKLPKGLKFTKKGFKKGLSIKSGTKKVKYTCVRTSGSNKLTSKNLCKKYGQAVRLTFKAGTLSATKKVKRPKITVTVTDSVKRTYTFVIKTK